MPALGGASAQPLRFLDYLIYQPIRAVLLHGPGVPVNIPSPEHYAIPKLIVASRRRTDNNGTEKSRKDLAQAATIMEAMIEQRQSDDLADGFMEAYDRGPSWQEAIRTSLSRIKDETREKIQSAIAASIRNLESDPTNYGLAETAPRLGSRDNVPI